MVTMFNFLFVGFFLAGQTNALQLAPLLSTCVDACQRGCREIRRIRAAGFGVTMKDAKDDRSCLTEADAASQLAIVGSLRSEWKDEIHIVGEEDESDLPSLSENAMFEPLQRDLFDDDIGETDEIDASRITIFVDPLDGTREFVEGRYENCQVLVGIAIDGEAVAGAVGIPFPEKGDLSVEPTIVYGLDGLGTGVRGTLLTRGPFPLDHHIDAIKYPHPHHASGEAAVPVTIAAKKAAIKAFGGSNVIYGGAGNKILAAALGEVACSIQHRVGGPWDLCAPQAILKAMGGTMTDLFGNEIEIFKPDAPSRCNERGFLATGPSSDHRTLAAVIAAVPEVQEYRKKVEADVVVQS